MCVLINDAKNHVKIGTIEKASTHPRKKVMDFLLDKDFGKTYLKICENIIWFLAISIRFYHDTSYNLIVKSFLSNASAENASIHEKRYEVVGFICGNTVIFLSTRSKL